MKKNNKNILVVEDDVDLCNAILVTLDQHGYNAVGVSGVRDGIFKLKNQKYALVILDMKIGTETGEEVIYFMRERNKGLNAESPILVISGFLDRDLVTAIANKVQGALVKPFEMDKFLEIVKKLAV